MKRNGKCQVRRRREDPGKKDRCFSPLREPLSIRSVFKPGEAFGNLKRRVQARFSHSGWEYRLWVTDPGYERKYLAQPDGDHLIGDCFITVSLGEPFNDACYKLVAAILERLP